MANTIPANNNTGLYNTSGNGTPISGNIVVNNISATGNINANGYISAVGNLATSGYVLGNGSLLTGLPETYSNANVEALLPVYSGNIGGNNITITGNLSSANIAASGDITAQTITADSLLSTNVDSFEVAAGLIHASSLSGPGNGTITADGNITGNNISATHQLTTANLSVTNQSNLTSVAATSVSASGNITGQYILGNGAYLSGLPEIYGNAQVAAYLNSGSDTLNIVTTGNVQGGYLKTSGTGGNIVGANYVSANYFVGNGSLLTGIATSYGNANVAAYLPTYTGNLAGGNVSVTGQVIGNGSGLTSLTGANVTGTVANATYATSAGSATTATSATTAGTVTTAAQANITSLGTLTSLSVSGNVAAGNVTAHEVSTSGNITAPLFIGNFQGNITGNLVVPGVDTNILFNNNGNAGASTDFSYDYSNSIVQLNGALSASGNITGGNFIGNGSALTSLTGANVTGTVANATYATSAGSATSATTAATVTSNAQANITSVGTLTSLSVTGNVNAGNLIGDGSGLTSLTGANVTGTVANAAYATTSGSATTANTVTDAAQANITSVGTLTSLSVSGNIATGGILTDGYYYANGAPFSGGGGGGTPGGNTTEIQFNNAGAFAGNSLMTFDNTTGNIGLGNLRVVSANTNAAAVIRNVNAWDTQRPAPGRIVFGTGYDGDYGNTYDINGFLTRSQVAVWNKYSATQNTQPTVNFTSALFVDNNTGANITLGSYQSGTFATYVNGPGNFGSTTNQSPTAYRGGGTSINVGNATIGNTIVTATTSFSSFTNVGAGSRIVDAVGTYVSWGVNGTGNVSNTTMNNLYGLSFNAGIGNTNATIGNVYLLHNQAIAAGTHNGNWGMGPAARQASRYYFIRNDDNVAQVKLGSLRTYHEYQYTATSSAGALDINKGNAQVQYVDVTEDITAITLSNFITAVNPGNGNQYQMDTVTVVFRQDSTGHAITMPTGSAYKYSGGATTMGTTANAVQMVAISAIYNTTTAATEYLITISPEFV